MRPAFRLAAMHSPPGSCDAEHVALRVLLVDDNDQFLRAATSSLRRNGIDVIGTATSSAAALVQIEDLEPDAVLVDIGLGDESGFDVVLELVRTFPYLESRVVLISTGVEDDFSELVNASPAVGFISKSELSASAIDELVSAGGY
jgi:DNA-binding NarL/FixJ family response regulator